MHLYAACPQYIYVYGHLHPTHCQVLAGRPLYTVMGLNAAATPQTKDRRRRIGYVTSFFYLLFCPPPALRSAL